MVLVMRSGVFIGSCDVISMEFPKGGKWLWSWVMSFFYSSDTHKCKKGVCVCVCCVMVKKHKEGK